MLPIHQELYLLFPQPVRGWAARLRPFCYELALILFQVLTEFFSSNIQLTMPDFSRLMRLALMGLVALLLLFKFAFLTAYESKRQFFIPILLLAFSVFLSAYDQDFWFVAVILLVIAGKGIDLQRAFRCYFAAGAASLTAVFLLHFTPLIPYMPNGRNYDFGFGHYNGYAGRLLGLFIVWLCLCFCKRAPKWRDSLPLLFLFVYCLFVVGARGASVAMLIIVLMLLLWKFSPGLFFFRPFQVLLIALPPFFLVCDLLIIRFFTEKNPIWSALNRFVSFRLSFLQVNAQTYPITLLGGQSTDTGNATCLDNTYYAIFVNKGILAALLLYAMLMFLMWVLLKKHAYVEACCLVGILFYGLTENKLLQLTCNPLFLLVPGLLYYTGLQAYQALSVSAEN